MKKYFINIMLIIITLITFVLQNLIFNGFNISGIRPNLLIIIIAFIALFADKQYGLMYGIIIGLIYDFMFGFNIGVSSFIYGILGFTIGVMDQNFSKDNKLTILFTVAISTIFYEIIYLIFKYMLLGFELNFVTIFNIVKILSIEVFFNSLITIIFYPLIQKFGFYIENEYKTNKILTRYY